MHLGLKMNLRYKNLFHSTLMKKLYFHKRFSSYQNIHIENLKRRALLKLSGSDTLKFLQGLITNDVSLLNPKMCSMYTLLLNSHGRVLYDCLLYKMNDDDYYLEYDIAAVDYLRNHLRMFKLRRDVSFEHVNDVIVWVAYSSSNKENHSQLLNMVDSLKENEQIILTTADPRISELGYRILSKTTANIKNILQHSDSEDQQSYDLFRYKLGIGEGVIDHPPGSCLPFETNVDFLNGVNFQKGCYVGQELTAKVKFTGVIRKRLLPVILFSDEKFPKFTPECAIVNEKGQKIGKLRNHIKKYGLATLNVEDSLKAESLEIKDFNTKVTVIKPNWWPEDVNK